MILKKKSGIKVFTYRGDEFTNFFVNGFNETLKLILTAFL